MTLEQMAHELILADQRAALSRGIGEYDAAAYWDRKHDELELAMLHADTRP